MNKYEIYTLDQLLEIVRNGRADVSRKAADEIRERFKSRPTSRAADASPAGFEDEEFDALLDSDIDGK